MATRAAAPRAEENVPRAANIKSGAPAAEGTRRRALGEIASNVATGVTTRSQKAGLDKTAKPRDPAMTASALRARAAGGPKKSGASLSALLQQRSEAAAGSKRAAAAAPPASPLPDIDAADRDDPLAAAEYAQDIYCYYRRVEPRFAAPGDYMPKQAEVNEKMRSILIDWLIEVHLKFKLMPETLYLTVNLIDRYLAKRNCTRKRLQLIGVTAMLIASKYEEIWAPEVRDFVYISDKAYSREDILQCEKTMLQALAYDLTVPTAFSFLARFKKAAAAGAPAPADPRVSQLAEFLIELALVDYKCLATPPSLLAAAALHVSLLACGAEGAAAYPRALRRHARYEMGEVAPVARALVALATKAPSGSLKAVAKKYSSTKFGEVAKMELPTFDEEAASA